MESIDGGETFSLEQNQILFSSNYFLHGDLVVRQKRIATVVNMASRFGGLFSIGYVIFKMIGYWINHYIIIGKFIRILYYVPSNGEKVSPEFQQDQKLDIIRFKFMDKFNIWNKIRKMINPDYNCQGNDIFKKGYELMT